MRLRARTVARRDPGNHEEVSRTERPGLLVMRHDNQQAVGDGPPAGGRNRQGGAPQAGEQPEQAGSPSVEVTSEPSRLLRIVGMARYLLLEVRDLDMDEASRERLHDLYEQAARELCDVLSPELREEFAQLRPHFEDEPPSQTELQIAQAQLLGWLEGVFQGVRVALSLQQTGAGRDLQSLRTARGAPALAAIASEQMPRRQPSEGERPEAGPYL